MLNKTFLYTKLQQLQIVLFIGIAICMGVFQRACSLLIAASVVIAVSYWLLTPSKNKFDKTWIIRFLPLFLLYIVYFISILYSQNKSDAWTNMERQLSLLVMPVIFVGMGRNFFTKKLWKWVGFAFVVGCLLIFFQKVYNLHLAVLYHSNFATALSNMDYSAIFDELIPNITYYTKDYPHLHPTYEALYVVLALSFIVINWIDRPDWYKNIGIKIFSIFSIICFSLLLSSSFSKAGQIMFALNCLTLLGYLFYRKKYIAGISIGFASVLFLSLFLFLAPGSLNRIKNSITVTKQFAKTGEGYDGSVVPRVYLLKNGCEVFAEKPLFGVGIGDGADVFYDHYQKTEYLQINQGHPHNQFLCTAIYTGIIGLLILLWSLFSALRYAIREHNLLFLLFLFSIFFTFNTDSILMIQLGIVFFCFFYCIFASGMTKKSCE